MKAYALGLDFGTASVRALLVRLADGAEVGRGVCPYAHGEGGVILDPAEPRLARQHPQDYLEGMQVAVREALAEAQRTEAEFAPEKVVGIGVDTTGSSPLAVDAGGEPLSEDPAALVWLWKDHTATPEAAEITRLARQERPHYIAKYGGTYSSEWYWAKLLRLVRQAPQIAQAAADWVEIQDWIPAVLTGKTDLIPRGVCAAGHKAFYHPDWGFPDEAFLEALHPELVRFRRRAASAPLGHAGQPAGVLQEAWARRLGLPGGIPVSYGAFDAHLGAVGAGVGPRTLVKILGTSTCDVMVAPLDQPLPDIPGLCGIVPEAVLPGHYSLEAGQSAVGDLFAWWTERVVGKEHSALSQEAEGLRPGESGLLALDWNNGNRTVLVDQELSGLLVGQSLYTRPAEVYRALLEATAFGARVIVERLEEYGVQVERVVVCGGIAGRNPLVLQIYADVLGRPLYLSRSSQTSALGAAVAGAVAAGAFPGFAQAQAAMTGLCPEVYRPRPEVAGIYNRLYRLYRDLHDAFGTPRALRLDHVMKELIHLREEVRR
ncbi:MAG: ribulokinase [Meiothermus sp.]